MTALRGTLTWWGCAAIELEANDQRIAFDPYLNPASPRIHYICITHNDYDHCHDRTLRLLTRGDVFEKIFVAPSCLVKSRLDSPIPGPSEDLSYIDMEKIVVMHPKYTKEPGKVYSGITEIDAGAFHIETIDSSERPHRYKGYPGAVWPDGSGPYVGDGQFPSLGYIVTDRASGTTFYHPGYLGQVYDAHWQLQNRIDVMFFPLSKLDGREFTILEAIRPRFIVPIHHRFHDVLDFPIPLDLKAGELEVMTSLYNSSPKPNADRERFRYEINLSIIKNRYPTPPEPPLERIRSLASDIKAEFGTTLLPLDAGRAYQIDELLRT